MQAAKQALWYLKGTIRLGFHYPWNLERLRKRYHQLDALYALPDSDFAWCKRYFLIYFGYMIIMNGGLVAYHSGRDYCTGWTCAHECSFKFVWFAVLSGTRNTNLNHTCVWVDSTAAIAVASGNDFTHERVKHTLLPMIALFINVNIGRLSY